MNGPDVTQLQVGLRSLGYSVEEGETTFGASTKSAVTRFYEDRGYSVVEVGGEELKAAEDAFTAADRAAATAETALRRAKRDYDHAVEAAEALGPAERPTLDGVDDATSAVEFAHEDLEAAREAVNTARAAAGPQIPLGEVAFLVFLPVTVDKISVVVGREVGEGTVQLAAGPLSAIATFPRPVGDAVSIDNHATLIAPDGERWEGVVSNVKLVSETESESDDRVEVTVSLNVPIEIPSGSTMRVNVATFTSPFDQLMVPEAALVTSADGETRVRVEKGQEVRDVVVTVGESGDGMVAVTPVTEGTLAEGDLVVIGVG
ncbi:Putative peptidoglycan binding domain-containing protein [Tessaracoccus flavus]|jgi:peptidoglycan hydrolase-like protein with peptidoglycan-binding domain|nr:Putative peptidoglycan binding domain-containing protein [Tessaracoccus flavus]